MWQPAGIHTGPDTGLYGKAIRRKMVRADPGNRDGSGIIVVNPFLVRCTEGDRGELDKPGDGFICGVGGGRFYNPRVIENVKWICGSEMTVKSSLSG